MARGYFLDPYQPLPFHRGLSPAVGLGLCRLALQLDLAIHRAVGLDVFRLLQPDHQRHRLVGVENHRQSWVPPPPDYQVLGEG